MIYEYHSTIFGGPVQVTYNRHGLLVGFQVMNAGELTKMDERITQLKNWMNESNFIAEANHNKLKLTKVERKVTFDMFWDAYKQKDCGRTKAEAVWNRLSKADQVDAFDYIDRLDQKLRIAGTAKAYATTYLNSKRWIQ